MCSIRGIIKFKSRCVGGRVIEEQVCGGEGERGAPFFSMMSIHCLTNEGTPSSPATISRGEPK